MAATEAVDAPRLGEVVGENVRRIREEYGLTQAEMAQRLRDVGLPWGRGQLAGFEAGNRAEISLSTMVMLATGLECRLAELVDGDPTALVRLTTDALVTRGDLVGLLEARQDLPRLVLQGHALAVSEKGLRNFRIQAGGDERDGIAEYYDVTPVQADVDLAERLGVPPDTVIEAAQQLWGRSMHQERDARLKAVGEGMSAGERRARRGHLTRQLTRELQAHRSAGEDRA